MHLLDSLEMPNDPFFFPRSKDEAPTPVQEKVSNLQNTIINVKPICHACYTLSEFFKKKGGSWYELGL